MSGQTDRIVAETVSLNYFDMLGVGASRGRVFNEWTEAPRPCRRSRY